MKENNEYIIIYYNDMNIMINKNIYFVYNFNYN